MQQRRQFLKNTSLLGLAVMLVPVAETLAAGHPATKGKVLVRSGWQTVNIGDIGHTFGLLSILQEQLPNAGIVLWLKSWDRGVEELVHTTFPSIQIIKSSVETNAPDLKAAMAECALMIHSSGPFVTAQKELQYWWDNTQKPFGVYGVSLDEVAPDLALLLDKASFFYCRDTESLKYFKTLNNKCPVQGFAPDATFGIKLYEEAKAAQYLKENGLKTGEFICVIPRLRYTPYWNMSKRAPTDNEKEREAISMAYKERDAVKMRDVIIAWVKATNQQVLICPEVTYQVDFSKETLYDPLPDDIKKNVVWRSTFWLPGEATSVYKQARAMVCCEPHSLIMAVANGIPSIHVKQATDTRKGQMWRDIGLGDWYFLMDETPASQISQQLLQIHNNYPAAQQKTADAMAYVKKLQKETMQVVAKSFSIT